MLSARSKAFVSEGLLLDTIEANASSTTLPAALTDIVDPRFFRVLFNVSSDACLMTDPSIMTSGKQMTQEEKSIIITCH